MDRATGTLAELATATADLLRDIEADRAVAAEVPPLAPRELFLEILAVALGNMFDRTPVPGQLYDRAMMKPIAAGLADTDIAKITLRSEDWIRLEGIVRAAEGQKAYILNRPSLTVLATPTPEGQLGSVLARICRCYAEGSVTPELRAKARDLASYFMTHFGQS
jgi:hypothetical protein